MVKGNSNVDEKNVERSEIGSCKYKGVRKRKWGKWVSEIRLPNSRERIWLGSYDAPEKAARAFDAALFCLRGKLAKFNFPDNPPEIAGGRSMSPLEIQAAAAQFAHYGSDPNLRNGDGLFRLPETESRAESPCTSVVSDLTVQLDSTHGELGMIDTSLSNFGSIAGSTSSFGQYPVEYGIFQGFDDLNQLLELEPNMDYGEDNIFEDANLGQDSFLWNF